MKTYYQVVIIGAGPAGLSAGIKLKEFGINCCIIEKSLFPRMKLCGGLITKKSIDIISELNIESVEKWITTFQINKVRIESCTSLISSFECSIPFTLVERIDFDDYLLRQYKAANGKIIEGIRAIQIDAASKSVLLGNGDKIKYDILIGADGISGISTKYAGNINPLVAFGVETSIPTSQLILQTQEIILDVGYLPNGYAWIFPKGESTTIGLACSFKKNIDYVGLLKRYVSSKCTSNLTYEIRGSFLPYGGHKAKIVQQYAKLLLVGDAAGFIDCVTGEGIYFAIKSGIIAAKVIRQHYLKNSDCICSDYEKSCHEIISIIKRSSQFMSFFYRHRKLILKNVRGHCRPLIFICDHQVSKYDYRFELLKIIKDYYKESRRKNCEGEE